jgi:hypothetical protein
MKITAANAANEAANTIKALNRSATKTIPNGAGQSPNDVAFIPSALTQYKLRNPTITSSNTVKTPNNLENRERPHAATSTTPPDSGIKTGATIKKLLNRAIP